MMLHAKGLPLTTEWRVVMLVMERDDLQVGRS